MEHDKTGFRLRVSMFRGTCPDSHLEHPATDSGLTTRQNLSYQGFPKPAACPHGPWRAVWHLPGTVVWVVGMPHTGFLLWNQHCTGVQGPPRVC